MYLTPLPQLAGGPNGSLVLTMIHEMGHALGVAASADGYILGNTNGIAHIYNSHLYDWRGVQATSNMVIRTDNHKVTADTYFDLPGSDTTASFPGIKSPYFSGAHVLAVLDGAKIATYSRIGIKLDQSPVPGIPINGLEGTKRGEYKEGIDLPSHWNSAIPR